MGQKASPIVLRLGIIRDADSIWFSEKKGYPSFLLEDLEIRKYIKRELKRSMVSSVIVKRKSEVVEVDVYSARPGVIIGKGGSDVSFLRSELVALTGKKIQINIKEEKKPDLSARLLAESVASQLERRIPFRRAMRQIIQRALKVGAQGIKVSCSGRIGGAEIARTEWYREGKVPLHTFRSDIDYAFAEALTTFGKIGVKVWVYKGEIYKAIKPELAEVLLPEQA